MKEHERVLRVITVLSQALDRAGNLDKVHYRENRDKEWKEGRGRERIEERVSWWEGTKPGNN